MPNCDYTWRNKDKRSGPIYRSGVGKFSLRKSEKKKLTLLIALVILKPLISLFRCVWLGLELNSLGPKLPIPAIGWGQDHESCPTGVKITNIFMYYRPSYGPPGTVRSYWGNQTWRLYARSVVSCSWWATSVQRLHPILSTAPAQMF